MPSGGPCWNRTNNLLIKSQVLCLVELTARFKYRGLVTGLTWVVNGFPERFRSLGSLAPLTLFFHTGHASLFFSVHLIPSMLLFFGLLDVWIG